jgi:ABC-type Zn uptake system ZnuABC Zn-binding protein ZnuA
VVRPSILKPGSRTIRTLAGFLALAVSLAACSRPVPTVGSGPLIVVTTTTVLADLVSQVGGELVSVTSLVPKNADVHTFEPRPSDVRMVAGAQLLVMNGLGLDDWLEKTIANAAAGAPLVKLGEDLPGVTLLPGEDPSTQNPHLFLDVKYAELYVDRIATALEAADPARAAGFQAQASEYKGRLESLDSWVRTQISTVAETDRKIVTFHDAFPYYAREYGITIVGVAVEAPGQDPSAGYIARLISDIKSAGVKAIFSERQFPARLVNQLGSETGCKVVSNLYDDSLGDPPVTTYEAVIRWDTSQLVGALQ